MKNNIFYEIGKVNPDSNKKDDVQKMEKFIKNTWEGNEKLIENKMEIYFSIKNYGKYSWIMKIFDGFTNETKKIGKDLSFLGHRPFWNFVYEIPNLIPFHQTNGIGGSSMLPNPSQYEYRGLARATTLLTPIENWVPNNFMNRDDITPKQKILHFQNFIRSYEQIVGNFYEDYIRRILKKIVLLEKKDLASEDIIISKKDSVEQIYRIYSDAIKKLLSLISNKQNYRHISYSELRILMPNSIHERLNQEGKKYFTDSQGNYTENNHDYFLGILITFIPDHELNNINIIKTNEEYWNYEVMPRSISMIKNEKKDKTNGNKWLGFVTWNKAFHIFVAPHKCYTLNEKGPNPITNCSMVEQSQIDGKRSEIKQMMPNSMIKFISD